MSRLARGYECPNGHDFPSVVAVRCEKCGAEVACEPASRGMALHASRAELDACRREELIGRLIEADQTLFESGDAVSHRASAEAALAVVEDYIDQRLRGQ